tara:strand:+ start:5973 stop:6479 length:507 start_codon:yes stop_codon:yes gene_type:complete
MEIIKNGKDLGTAIKRAVNQALKWQDKVQELFVSSAWHYSEHGDSTYLSMLVKGITKCDGVNKQKLIGFVSEVCQVNWDKENLRFKKAKKSEFEFDMVTLHARKWYDFEVESSLSIWQLKKLIEKTTADIEKHSDEARDQVMEAYDAIGELNQTIEKIAKMEEWSEAA